jgi:hypothetical protein
VVVGQGLQHAGGIDVGAAVERHQELHLRIERLQHVHVVRECDAVAHRVVPRVEQMIVPRGSRERTAWQQALVGVQHRFVFLVGKGTEHGSLRVARVVEDRKRLVAVARDEHAVESFHGAGSRAQRNAGRIAPYAGHGRAQAHAVPERRAKLLHVFARAAFDGLPDGPVVDVEEAVFVEELDEETRRETEHRAFGGRPDRHAHRHDELFAEGSRITVPLEIFAEGQRVIPSRQQRAALFVEAQDVGDHSQERRAQRVAPLRKQRVDARAVVFEPVAFVTQRETHVRALVRDVKLVQQRDETRVGPVVEDDEPGIHREMPAFVLDIDRVGVTTDMGSGFENRDVVEGMQSCGDHHAGDARTYDRNTHEDPDVTGLPRTTGLRHIRMRGKAGRLCQRADPAGMVVAH